MKIFGSVLGENETIFVFVRSRHRIKICWASTAWKLCPKSRLYYTYLC